MQYRPLGRTGLLVSEICFGTMTFGDNDGLWANIGTLGVDDAVEQLRMSFDAGLNFIDTANIYHQGRTEEIIGEALRKAGVQRDSYILATKVRGRMSADPNGVGLTRHHILNEIDNSLRRLGHDHVDLYQIHGFDPATPFDETLRALDDVVRSGKVRHIGLCNLAAWQIMKCLAISEMSGLGPLRIDTAVLLRGGPRHRERDRSPCGRSGVGNTALEPAGRRTPFRQVRSRRRRP
jgi:aryl-alcohol dehydrogenase-like predicted oxidoreductase